jgi:tripartite-type tricarboxylate transporter receptor subunit TctC
VIQALRNRCLPADAASACRFSITTAGATPAPIAAQEFPTKPIRLIVPFPAGGTPEYFGNFINAEIAKWAKVIKDAGVETTK